MSFQLEPKSVTLNDLEQHSDPYFVLFHRIRYDVVIKKWFTFVISSPDEFLVSMLNFKKFKILMADRVKRTNMHNCAKFCGSRSKHYRDVVIFQLSRWQSSIKMAVVHHLGLF